MKKFLSISFTLSRKTLILTVLFALLLSGAASAERVITRAQATDVVVEDFSVQPALDEAPPDPDELPGNMESKTRPNCEQPATFNANTFSVTPDNSPHKLRRMISCQPVVITIDNSHSIEKRIRTSVAIVHTRLAHNVTLVGHKPSGTI